MDNEEINNGNNIDNSTSDSSVDAPNEEIIIDDTPEEPPKSGNAGIPKQNNNDGEQHNSYDGKDDRLNNAARNMDNLTKNTRRTSDNLRKAGNHLNNFANKRMSRNPNSIAGKVAGTAGGLSTKAGDKIGEAADALENANDTLQDVNNKANIIKDPLGTAKEKAVDKAKEKAEDFVKDKAKKLLLSKVLIIIIVTILLIGLILVVVSFISVIVAGAASSQNQQANNVASNGECGFSISATSLSRDEYINAIKTYSSSHSISSDFVNNAGTIYDRSTAKGVNPELVIIRAIAESGANSTSAPYNYWGMGCTNTGGGKDCHSYASFMDGVDEFLENISKYTSLNDMMSNYSYLGDYWYNPGDSGTGGCYYASFIYDTIPSRVKTACASGKECSGSNCVKTTSEEKEQYTKWQVEKNMADIREKVFGLKFEEGVSCNSESNGTLEELTSYPEGHSGLKMLTSSLTSSEINQLNNYIKSSVDKSGYGTGAGVAAAGQSLIYGMRQLGYYLPYYWGGGHGDGAARIGVSSFLGTSGKSCSDRSGTCYHHHSFDCSGFVSWAIKNGCKSSFTAVTASTFNSSKFGSTISIKDAKPGDIMATSGHVILIVKNNGDGTVMTADANGSSDEGRIVFVKRDKNDSHKPRDMSKWYKNNCDK